MSNVAVPQTVVYQPLAKLAPGSTTTVVTPVETVSSTNWVGALIGFIILVIIIWIIIFATQPSWAKNAAGQLDSGKALWSSIIIAIIIMLIIWVLKSMSGKSM
ncbi:unnamed protein product [Sphagnum balticum]